ncbi:hypothetical protein U5A82_13570 [Sphingobium sp. CR2-8]|uniref:Cap15 family cyclic dinucleotide receptor domain-containing protein n=1 Tax=Sphingobium sp. CR2-8 TaxID=1306534 RepID=UPI002DBA0F3A|nr:hypothetical protein [Sphingobium sp. CR2-8]MEC3911454.1 hypothetical protein [Sphingobium sp. CR2-8]
MSDICGLWTLTAKALNQDGSLLYDWDARVQIEPDGDGSVQMTVDSEHSKSRAISAGAQVRTMPDGRTTLLYDYIADPTHEGTASHDFFGLVRYVFDAAGDGAQGHYLNYNGRYTLGELSLKRVT